MIGITGGESFDDDFVDLVFADDDLTWELVSKASRANEPSYPTTTSFTMSERGNNSSTSSTQGQRASQRPSPSSVMLINDENEIQEDVGNGANKFVGVD